MRQVWPWVAPLVFVACFEEPDTGSGGDGGAEPGSTSEAMSTLSATATVPTSGAVVDSGEHDSSASADVTSSESGDSAETSSGSGGDACLGEGAGVVLWAEDGTVVAPMELLIASLLPRNPAMARSYAAETGSISWSFALSCPATVQVHGLAWDSNPGVFVDDPDSFFVTVDGRSEIQWTYGCGAADLPAGATWSWQVVGASSERNCDLVPLELSLDAGTHTIRLRNRETGSGRVYAGVAALVVTDDPTLDPATLYDPYR